MPANNDIYTTTPGSAVAQTLQEILQRKRDLSRQAMLDRMAQEEQTSQIAARQAQTELGRNQEARLSKGTDSDIAANNARIASENETLFQSKLKNLPRGKKPTDVGTLEELRKRGLMEEAPMFGPPSEAQPEGSKFEGYVGTPEEQQHDELMALFDAAAGQSDDPNMKTGINILKAGGPAIPFFLGPQDTTIYDAGSQKTSTLKGIRPGSVEVIPRQAPLPAGYLDKEYTVTDKEGNVRGSVSLSPGKEKDDWHKENPDLMLRSGSFKPGADKTGLGTSDISILAGAYQRFQEAQQAYDNSYTDFSGNGKAKVESTRKLYETVAKGIAAKAGISPKDLEAATVIGNDPELSAMDLKDAIKELDGVHPEELNMQNLQKALLLFGGQVK